MDRIIHMPETFIHMPSNFLFTWPRIPYSHGSGFPIHIVRNMHERLRRSIYAA